MILLPKQGCIQRYGNYKELTSSGLDPTELFDDLEDYNSSNLESLNVEAGDKVHFDLPTSPTDAQRLLVDRTLVRGKQLHSEGSVTDEVSLCTAPSMFSLVSMPSYCEGLNENTKYNEVEIYIMVNCVC